LFEALASDVATFTQSLESAVQSIVDVAGDAEARIRAHAATLAERHAVQEADYRRIVAASEEQGGRAAERVALQTSLANAQAAANERLAKEKQRQGLTTARN